MPNLKNEFVVEGEGSRKIMLLEYVNNYSCSYVDRGGHKRFVFRLIGNEFYFFNNEYFQEAFIVDKNRKEEIKFIEGGKELTLEEMLKSQLSGSGNFFYFKLPFSKDLTIGEK